MPASSQTLKMSLRVPMTPGVRFLLSGSLILCIPSLVSITVYKTKVFQNVISTRLYIMLSIFFIPTLIFLRIMIKEFRQRLEAYKMGARLAPRIEGRLPGNIDIMIRVNHDELREWSEAKGPIYNVKILSEDFILTTCPKHIQQILATEFKNFEKGEQFRSCMSAVLGVGVFNTDGEMWKFHRQMTRPFFTRDRISHFELFDKHAERAIQTMKSRLREGTALDFQDLMGKFTIDSATEFLFGCCVNNLSSPLPYPPVAASRFEFVPTNPSPTPMTQADLFAKAFLQAQEAIANREAFGALWPIFEILGDKVEGPMKIVSDFVEPIISEALRKKKTRGVRNEKVDLKNEVGDDETLLDHLVDITNDPVVLKDATLNILIAGRDTTAATLTFIMYFLATHPEVTTRLRNEVLDTVGTSAEGREISWEMVKEMKYLRAVINETLRLYPVVPFNVRDSINATTLTSPEPDKPPIYIPAGTRVGYSVFMMHRRKDLWGPDAEVFDPDRFLDSRLQKYLSPRPFIFLPFNAGPRICLGQQFAYNEMSLMLIRLLQHFHSFTFIPECTPPEFQTPAEWEGLPGRKGIDKFFPKRNLTMHSGGGLWIKAEELSVKEDSTR